VDILIAEIIENVGKYKDENKNQPVMATVTILVFASSLLYVCIYLWVNF